MQMNTLPGYTIIKKIFESSHSEIYRGLRSLDDRPVVLKLLKKEYPSPQELARFRKEFEITNNLNSTACVEVYELKKYNNSLVIIMEDFGGDSLADIFETRNLDMKEKLSLSADVARILGKVHRSNIIHKDINPSNIVWNSAKKKLKLIDFGISTELSQETPEILSPGMLEGTLAYMSPEQTGRMNRAMDYRTDIYSLGVMFYEIFTGEKPFVARDPVEIVHSHIAKIPRAPHEVNPDIPLMISKIIVKLMAKNAEDRYQSSRGVREDLIKCRQALDVNGEIAIFDIGESDISERFHISQKLYGREKEINDLLASFERVSQGQTEMILVAGYSGIGKSALVHEVHKPIIAKRGFIISGKYNQYQRNVPYSAFIEAFRELTGQILSETAEKLGEWKEKILFNLGSNGQIIVDVIPEIELIIGPQKPVSELSPAESLNRFNLVFLQFIKVCARADHPLVIFLDDLQWVDTASLALLEVILENTEVDHLLFICAYRDNEVSPSHPFMMSVERIRERAISPVTLTLAPLDESALNRLIADSLQAKQADVFELGQLVMEKTGGNPFFTGEFLSNLYYEKFLIFDHVVGGWVWDTGKIKSRDITGNVVEFMLEKIRRLPQNTQDALQVGASLGNVFDIQTICQIVNKPPVTLARDLWPAVQERFLRPQGRGHNLVRLVGQHMEDKHLEEMELLNRFQHDRVQQAAYKLIGKDERIKNHLRIGRAILNNTPEKELDEKIFLITKQLNTGADFVTDPEEKFLLANLNLKAGIKAKDSSAYGPAAEHLRFARRLIQVDGHFPWDESYQLSFDLHREGAEAEYLAGNYEEAEVLFGDSLEHARGNIDKALIYKIMMQYYISIGRYRDDIDIGIKALKSFGIELPDQNDLEKVGKIFQNEFKRYDKFLEGREIAELAYSDMMQNPEMEICMDILFAMLDAAFFGNGNVLGLLLIKMINISLEYGNTPSSAFSYSWFGIVLISQKNYDDAMAFVSMAVVYAEKIQNTFMLSRAYSSYGTFIAFYKEPIQTSIDHLKRGFAYGNESGDVNYANYCATLYNRWAFYYGNNLEDVIEESEVSLHFMEKTRNSPIYEFHLFMHFAYLSLAGRVKSRFLLRETLEDEERVIKVWEENNSTLHASVYTIQKLLLHYLFDDYENAAVFGAKAEESKLGLKPAYDYIHINLYYSPRRRSLWRTRKFMIGWKNLWKNARKNWSELIHNWWTPLIAPAWPKWPQTFYTMWATP